MTHVLVTGATGTVGRHVVDGIRDVPDLAVTAASRDPVRARDRLDCATVPFDFTVPATYRDAFADVEALFLVRPPALSRVRRDIVPALAAAVGAGVEHVVFLSVIGADTNPFVPHARIESWLADAGLETTFLRASFFMQNLSTTHREEIRNGRLAVPAGNGKTSFVDARDVAAVAVRTLRTRTTGAYDLTGPEALDYDAVCRQLSAVLDHDVAYTDPSLPRFLVSRYRLEGDLAKVGVMAAIYTTARLGLADRVTDDVHTVLDRPPIDVRTFARDNRSAWL
ncbi:NmrA family NAD(P)-binding protein [Natrinema ejinorense]|uniref:NAD(P)-dependent oxidoreductase n=1 Tax=Natrinema ejinorense TaxID=373386 RepID=A0A2A5QTS5_9EURY|nr:NAD(P)H-binding protein [Natrinema ejinorense]PCR90214.1 NAD(P)-dependent oxidoreductase [Natrinema ejinorense]